MLQNSFSICVSYDLYQQPYVILVIMFLCCLWTWWWMTDCWLWSQRRSSVCIKTVVSLPPYQSGDGKLYMWKAYRNINKCTVVHLLFISSNNKSGLREPILMICPMLRHFYVGMFTLSDKYCLYRKKVDFRRKALLTSWCLDWPLVCLKTLSWENLGSLSFSCLLLTLAWVL